jgi:hypothetical protein
MKIFKITLLVTKPDLKKSMKEAGVIGEPTVLILGGQK